MKKKPLTIRGQRSDEHRHQHRLLNALRLAYFLHPDKLASERVGDGNDMEYISGLYKKCGWPDESNDGEMMFYIRSNSAFINIVKGIVGPGFSQENSDKLIEEHTNKSSKHWSSPENVPIYLKGGLPKIVGFDEFVKRVIEHHLFELAKCRKLVAPGRKIPESYADYVAQQRNSLGINKRYADRVIRQARIGEKRMARQENSGQAIDDKSLAQKVYGTVSTQTLARVRQDRRRLKKYGLL